MALTLSALSTFGVHVFQDEPRLYRVLGGQAYRPYSGSVEGDFSQAAFFLVAGALGKGISIRGVKTSSLQGDKAILPILQRMGAKLEEGPESLTIHPSSLHGIRIDASDCPDLVPILSVAAALAKVRRKSFMLNGCASRNATALKPWHRNLLNGCPH